MREEAKNTQAIVRTDDDHALLGQVLTVIAGFGTRSRYEASAVEPQNDGKMFVGGFGWCPDVQVQAIFAWSRIAENHIRKNRKLHTAGAELCRFASVRPRLDWLRCLPTEVSHRWGSEGHAAENSDGVIVPGGAFDGATFHFHPVGRRHRAGDGQCQNCKSCEPQRLISHDSSIGPGTNRFLLSSLVAVFGGIEMKSDCAAGVGAGFSGGKLDAKLVVYQFRAVHRTNLPGI